MVDGVVFDHRPVSAALEYRNERSGSFVMVQKQVTTSVLWGLVICLFEALFLHDH